MEGRGRGRGRGGGRGGANEPTVYFIAYCMYFSKKCSNKTNNRFTTIKVLKMMHILEMYRYTNNNIIT